MLAFRLWYVYIGPPRAYSLYYFYRLLTRARKVELLYDIRTSGISSDEMSRYLHQLRYLECFPDIISGSENMCRQLRRKGLFPSKTQIRTGPSAKSGRLYLSASALKTFKMSLAFYLKYIKICGMSDEVKDYTDEAT